MRLRSVTLALGWCVLGTAIFAAGDPAARFADITLRILTTGNKQPLQEAGVFSTSLPLGQPGGLHRNLSISNQTKGTALSLALSLQVTPSLGEDGLLHCVVTSEAAPAGGTALKRAKDISFTHPGEQLMELYGDPVTGTRVSLALAAALHAETETQPSPESQLPPITFLVRVEQWTGAQRSELENLQLQSLDGAAVTHDYSRRQPRWVEGETTAGDPTALDQLPVLDTSAGPPTIKAGQGFSILLPPKEGEKRDKPGADAPSGSQGGQGAPKARKLTWDEEYYHVAIQPLRLMDQRLRVQFTVNGQVLDPANKMPGPVMNASMERDLQIGQPTPFYLTRDLSGGPVGFVLWVLPQWPILPPPASGGGQGTAKEKP